jgi:hypothetical protein
MTRAFTIFPFASKVCRPDRPGCKVRGLWRSTLHSAIGFGSGKALGPRKLVRTRSLIRCYPGKQERILCLARPEKDTHTHTHTDLQFASNQFDAHHESFRLARLKMNRSGLFREGTGKLGGARIAMQRYVMLSKLILREGEPPFAGPNRSERLFRAARSHVSADDGGSSPRHGCCP